MKLVSCSILTIDKNNIIGYLDVLNSNTTISNVIENIIWVNSKDKSIRIRFVGTIRSYYHRYAFRPSDRVKFMDYVYSFGGFISKADIDSKIKGVAYNFGNAYKDYKPIALEFMYLGRYTDIYDYALEFAQGTSVFGNQHVCIDAKLQILYLH